MLEQIAEAVLAARATLLEQFTDIEQRVHVKAALSAMTVKTDRRDAWGPGYRIYFGMDGSDLVVLLGGGSKKDQQEDIAQAQERWRDYRRRKTKE